ncbi:hypothetical protein CSE16_12975 [Solibacillus sp. R5-41]|uniref:CPCC family cysteine-rich protein n=1 Tax=Solibacillus sp. R5-41 TaxID=2048654 RepID=UPI000C12977B|nr:CPCC family cysteine-rich protein [Solibacillus sp. R5-41]ATP40885.1 hypothetical protein CSE16_12975 [Solibacillus sp. R5-41]
MKYTCPCCGYKTLPEEPSDTFYICRMCGWEDDGVQFHNPDLGGANKVSLKQAQKNFIKFGASEERFVKNGRKLNEEYIKDPNWKQLL